MRDEEEFSALVDKISESVLDRLPDDRTILLAETGELEEDVYLAVIFLAHLETRDVHAIADEFDKTVQDIQIDLFNAQHKVEEEGGFRSVVQSACVHAGISNQKLMDALNNPPEEFVPH